MNKCLNTIFRNLRALEEIRCVRVSQRCEEVKTARIVGKENSKSVSHGASSPGTSYTWTVNTSSAVTKERDSKKDLRGAQTSTGSKTTATKTDPWTAVFAIEHSFPACQKWSRKQITVNCIKQVGEWIEIERFSSFILNWFATSQFAVNQEWIFWNSAHNRSSIEINNIDGILPIEIRLFASNLSYDKKFVRLPGMFFRMGSTVNM